MPFLVLRRPGSGSPEDRPESTGNFHLGPREVRPLFSGRVFSIVVSPARDGKYIDVPSSCVGQLSICCYLLEYTGIQCFVFGLGCLSFCGVRCCVLLCDFTRTANSFCLPLWSVLVGFMVEKILHAPFACSLCRLPDLNAHGLLPIKAGTACISVSKNPLVCVVLHVWLPRFAKLYLQVGPILDKCI